MTKLHINIGDTANDRTGDPLRTAFEKVNSNFDELYALAGADVQIPVQTNNGGKILTTNGTVLSWVTPASTGDISFNNNNIRSFSGVVVDNSDSTHGPTAAVVVPSNGSQSQPVSLTNIYGHVKINTSPTPGTPNTWIFGSDGTTSFPNQTLKASTDSMVIRTEGASGNSNSRVDLYGNGTGIGSQDDETGPNSAWVWNFTDISDSTRPSSSIVIKKSDTGDEHTWTFNADGDLQLPSGVTTTSGAIQQKTTRTVTQGITTVEAGTSGIIFSANSWQTGFKLVIMVETRLDDNVDDVDHTQVCEATIAANYNSEAEPTMSVYGLTYTSPNPLAIFEIQRGLGTIEVVATNVQTQYNLAVSVHAIQFGSFYD